MGKLSPRRLAYEKGLAKRFTSGGVLIFLHIPKCAGKTMSLVLQRESLRQKLTIKGYGAEMLDHKKEFQSIDVLRGHSFYGIHRFMRKPHVYLTLLRDPVERVISLYYWLRLHVASVRHVQTLVCQKLSLRDWAEREESAPYVSNVMTKTIAGTHSGHDGLGVFIGNHGTFYGNPLAAAKRHLREKFIFDVVSRFNRGYSRFRDLFGWSNAPYVNANVINHLYPERSKIAAKAIAAIEERNKQDRALVKYAVQLLHGEERT